MAVMYHPEVGVEVDVPDAHIEIFCGEDGSGWIEGPAPWPRDDFGVAMPPPLEDSELAAILDEEEAFAAFPTPPHPRHRGLIPNGID